MSIKLICQFLLWLIFSHTGLISDKLSVQSVQLYARTFTSALQYFQVRAMEPTDIQQIMWWIDGTLVDEFRSLAEIKAKLIRRIDDVSSC